MVTKLVRPSIFLLSCMLLCIELCVAQAAHAVEKHRAVADAFYSEDTDKTRVLNFMLGYEHLFDEGQFLGAQVGSRRFHGEDAPVQNNNFSEARLTGRKNLVRHTFIQGSLSKLSNKDWSPLLHNLVLSSTPNKTWHFELSSEKNVIETASAIAKQLTVHTYGANVDYALNEQHAFILGAYQQDISDHNKRTGTFLQYLYQPGWFKHGYFKLSGKQRRADFDPAEYFSPKDFKQYHLFIGYKAPLGSENNLRFHAEVGAGRQYINDVGEGAYEYRLGLRGWLYRQSYLDTNLGCTTDGGASNYRYCSGRLVFNYLW